MAERIATRPEVLRHVLLAATLLLAGTPAWTQTQFFDAPAVAARACAYDSSGAETCQVTGGTVVAETQFSPSRGVSVAAYPGFGAFAANHGGGDAGAVAIIPFRVLNPTGAWKIDLRFSASASTFGPYSTSTWLIEVGTLIQPLALVAGTDLLGRVGYSGPLVGGFTWNGLAVPFEQWTGDEARDNLGNCGSSSFVFNDYFDVHVPAISDTSSDCFHGDRQVTFPLVVVPGVQYVVMVRADAPPGSDSGGSTAVVDPELTVDPSNPDAILEVDAPVAAPRSLLTADDVAWLTAAGFDLSRLTRVGITLPTANPQAPPVTTAVATPGPNALGWNNTDVLVTLTAADAGGPGVGAINYSLSGAQTGSGATAGGNGSVPITAEGTTTLTYFAQDSAGVREAPKTLVVQIDKTPPSVIFAAPVPAANAAGWNNTNVTLSFTAADNLSGLSTMSPASPVVLTAEGRSLTTTVTVSDRAGNTATYVSPGVNIDRTPPVVGCAVTPAVLWPPDHRLAPVSASVSVSDALSGAAGFSLTAITSNEPLGPADIQGFVVGSGATAGQLLADRLGTGTGRVYTLTWEGMDIAGNAASCATAVTVPHDQRR